MRRHRPSGQSPIAVGKPEKVPQTTQSRKANQNSRSKPTRLDPDAIPAALKKTFSKSPPLTSSTLLDTSLGESNTTPSSWRRGDIIRVPHLVPALNVPPTKTSLSSSSSSSPPDPALISTPNLGLISAQLRYAIIVSVLPSNIIALPIFTSSTASASIQTTMSILPTADSGAHILATDPFLFVRGGWHPAPGSYINLAEPLVVQYAWPLARTDKLDARSTALLMQRWRIVHNMGFVPRELAEAYFRAMVTRERVLAPGMGPDEDAAEEFYGGNEGGGGGVLFGRELRVNSLGSENEDLLVDDLGMGVVRGVHDEEAAARLVEWKPSLALLLGDGREDRARSGRRKSPVKVRLVGGFDRRRTESVHWDGLNEERQRSLSTGLESLLSIPWSDMASPNFAGEITKAKKSGAAKKQAKGRKNVIRDTIPKKAAQKASEGSKKTKADASISQEGRVKAQKQKPDATPTRRNPTRTAKEKSAVRS